MWEQTYEGPGDEDASSGVLCADGGFLAAGYTTSFGAGGMDLYALRVDANGGRIWEKTYGNDRHQDALRVVENDGGFTLVGYDNPVDGGRLDFYAMGIDVDGNKIWENDFGGDQDEIAESAVSLGDNGSLLVGFTNSTTDGPLDVFLVRIDHEGNELWNRSYGGDKGDGARCLALTEDGGFMIAGYADASGAFPHWGPERDVLLLRTDGNGNILWNTTRGGSEFDEAIGIVACGHGEYIVVGETFSMGQGNSDVYLIRFKDLTSMPIWEPMLGAIVVLSVSLLCKRRGDQGYRRT